jgi:hypothetical protein
VFSWCIGTWLGGPISTRIAVRFLHASFYSVIGYRGYMGDKPDRKRVVSRAKPLLSEEREAGSDDPPAQAEAILTDSEARTEDRVSPPGKPVEHRHSEDTVEPTD